MCLLWFWAGVWDDATIETNLDNTVQITTKPHKGENLSKQPKELQTNKNKKTKDRIDQNKSIEVKPTKKTTLCVKKANKRQTRKTFADMFVSSFKNLEYLLWFWLDARNSTIENNRKR